MTDTKHTPGPWTFVEPSERYGARVDSRSGIVASCFTSDPTACADARLIAAAPALLEAARAVLVLMARLAEVDQRIPATANHPTESECNLSHYATYHADALRAAIAAAEGEAS